MNEEELEGLPLPKQAYAFILAGGKGSRLMQMTDKRCKPAVYFGGKFRIIDFALSNCLNSGIRRIGVLTQYRSYSLLRHLQRGWSFLKGELNESIDLLPAQQKVDETTWYRGTADAVFQNMDIVLDRPAKYIIVLAGDHIYKMNYAKALNQHVKSGAPCSVGCIEVPIASASEFGVMHVNPENRIEAFLEKPANPPSMPGNPDVALASMGIYIFDANYLIKALAEDAADADSEHDFGKNVVPAMVARGDAVAQHFAKSCVGLTPEGEPYWRDVGTLDAYWEANLDLTETVPSLDLYDKAWPIWTYQEQLPPAKFVHNWEDRRGVATESMVSGGCIISGTVDKSLLFSRCRVHSYAKVNASVLLPEVEVGRSARLTKCIIDHRCVIPDGLVIGEDPTLDDSRFHRTANGITLVTPPMLERLAAGQSGQEK